jgi:hypothetical protein
MKNLRFCLVILSMLAFVMSAKVLWAQSTATGTIAGLVSDPSGAVVPGATVTLTDATTGAPRTATTNDAGRYFFANVTPGKYDLSFTKMGFAAAKLSAQEVEIGKSATINIMLPVGSTNEVIEVQGSSVQLQTMSATVGDTITGTALDVLPSLGRDVSSFFTLQPGVAPDGSVAGAIYDQNSFQLDGGQNTNDMDGSMNIYTPSFAGDSTGGLVSFASQGGPGNGGGPTGVMPTPADSIEEFKVGTNNQTADFNSSAGAEITMVTKRGTSAWHGTGYEYYLPNGWSANSWSNNNSNPKIPVPSFHYHRFGAAAGGPILPSLLGGKTYFFANYQAFRWGNSESIERTVPSDAMRLGLLQFGGAFYNLNNTPVTYKGTTYPGNAGCAGLCDPRMLGISPTVQSMWSKLPEPNDLGCAGIGSFCDGTNVQGFRGNMAIPQKDNFFVARLDHDFGAKWHFNASYRYYKLTRATDSQFDISSGAPISTSSRPQQPWFFVAGLTTIISPNTTNDLHYSYLRNYWSWATAGAPPQLPGLGAALEPFGELSREQVLSPYNVNTQNVRTRFWDGQDNMIRDDVSMLKNNHLLQFGGTYQRNWDYHQRSDNGGGINFYPVYQLGTQTNAGITVPFPAGLSANDQTNYGRDFAAALGIVSISQITYTRSGSQLNLNPPLTPAFDQSTIPFYNVYFSDTWHMKPSFTLTYGLGWTLEMPPTEAKGKQIVLVNQSAQPIDLVSYLSQRKASALQGEVYNPEVGFALVGNVAGHPKYPYDPFYKSFSPRIAGAWNPSFSPGTVIRAGYSRIYGRLNGVGLVLVPLLGTGLLQAVQCIGPQSPAFQGANGQCNASAASAANAFRIGPTAGGWDGLTAPIPAASATLPQPDFPGFNSIAPASPSVLDPHFRPNSSDQFDLTMQRQLTNKTVLEVGYIGRLLHNEYQPVNINAVPYMMTLGGQQFANAYANIEKALGCAGPSKNCGANEVLANIPTQPFFEAALKGTGYCNGFLTCTQAVVSNEGSTTVNPSATGNLLSQSVWSLWSDLDKGGFNFPRSMMNTPIGCVTGTEIGCNGQITSGIAVNGSNGYGNYNGLFATIRMADWRGLTMQSNFTWSKALGTGSSIQATSTSTVADPFDFSHSYGNQPWDRTFVYNMFVVYQPPVYKGQHGIVGRVLGGWTFAPIFSAGSGLPLAIFTKNTSEQSFGEADSSGNFFASSNLNIGSQPGETAVLIGPYNQGNSRHTNSGSNGIGTGGTQNMFTNPEVAYNLFRSPILGLDNGHINGGGNIRGLPFWNMDMSVRKAINITERFSAELTSIFTNILNHNQMVDPVLDLTNPATWGVLSGQANNPRQMEFGIRVRF